MFVHRLVVVTVGAVARTPAWSTTRTWWAQTGACSFSFGVRRSPVSLEPANAGPRMRAYDYAVNFVGEDDYEADYVWHQGVTICSSRAARIKLRHQIRDANEPESGVVASWYVTKRRAGCKRFRWSFSQNLQSVRTRVILAWHGLRVVGPWREATCQPRCP